MITRYDQGMNTHPETPDHPLTETAAAELWGKHVGDTVPWGDWYGGSRRALTSLLRAAFDAGREHERTNPVDARPWDPLVRYHPLNVGDEVRQNRHGLTITGVVGRVDDGGDPWTDGGALIGLLRHGTWWVRQAVQELPAEHDGVVLVPADGHEGIATTDGQRFARLTFTTKQSIWYGPNLAAQLGDWVIQTTSPSRLIPGTWKVGNR